MRRSSPLVRRGSEVDMDSAMTPMIDVVFLLLVFFVWTASFQIIEHVLPSEMSTQTGSDPTEQVDQPTPKDYDDVVVQIGWTGELPTYKINGNAVASLQEVQTRLNTIGEIEAEAVVILDPESIVPLGHVIEAYDIAKLAGFQKISFAVNPRGK